MFRDVGSILRKLIMGSISSKGLNCTDQVELRGVARKGDKGRVVYGRMEPIHLPSQPKPDYGVYLMGEPGMVFFC